MNWFKFIAQCINFGAAVSDNFVKNPESKAKKEAVVGIISGIVEALANQNPDGTPASQPYNGLAASVSAYPVDASIIVKN